MGLAPDGRSVLALRLTSPPHLFVLPVGPGATRAIERATIAEYQRATWFPDGRRVLFAGSEEGRAARLYVQELDGREPRPITPEGVGLFFGNPVSPDGDFVATLGPDQRATLYPVTGRAPRPVRGLEAGEAPIRWSADGRSLYAYRRGDLPARIYRVELGSGRRTLWREVMPADPAGIYDIDPVLVSPDGAAYAYTYSRVLSELYLVEGLE
jgi:dipeptidyl aminopeptidase/acylaminoacyl peptidase